MIADARAAFKASKSKTTFIKDCVKKADKYLNHQDYETLKLQFADMAETAYTSVKVEEDKKKAEEKAREEAFLLKLELDARIAVGKGQTIDKFIIDSLAANPERDSKTLTQ